LDLVSACFVVDICSENFYSHSIVSILKTIENRLVKYINIEFLIYKQKHCIKFATKIYEKSEENTLLR